MNNKIEVESLQNTINELRIESESFKQKYENSKNDLKELVSNK